MAKWVGMLVLVGAWVAATYIWGDKPAEPQARSRSIVLAPPEGATELPSAPASSAPLPGHAASDSTDVPAEKDLQVQPPSASMNDGETSSPPPLASASGALDIAETLAHVQEYRAKGDLQGAEGVLRAALAASHSASENARIGLFLATFTSNKSEARELLSRALKAGCVLGEEYDVVSQKLRELNHDPASSLIGLLATREYVVQPNDSLWQLCNRHFPKEFGVSPEVGLIQLLNGMSGTSLRVGQRLRVPQANLELHVDRAQRGLAAYLGPVAVAAYRIGLGKEGRTPSGQFRVEVKQENPTWYHDGQAIPFGQPENILGTRWMGFQDSPGVMGYGIHGTSQPESIGKDESMGCVRMRNQDVEELFLIVAHGTIVTIP